jgi:CheY-like chemotaxis protein
VTTSVNGLNALSLLRSQPNHFDLVLSDVVMPGELRAARL